MPERAKKAVIARRQFSGSSHTSKVEFHEQKHHEQNCVFCGILGRKLERSFRRRCRFDRRRLTRKRRDPLGRR